MRSLPRPRCRRELESLLSAHCDGSLDRAGETRLVELLEDDRDARRYYLQYIDLHLDLARRTASSKLVPMPPQAVRHAKIWRAVAAVAILAAVSTVALMWDRRPAGAGASIDPLADVVEDGPVAYVSRAEDVTWDYRAIATPGLELQSGDAIELAAGRVRIDFFDGSSATIAAPARFTLFSSREISLESGQIAVRSDGPTPGFAVRTPRAVFIDVGTEFALSVIDAVGTQMRVIEGEVIATLLSADDVALEERSAFAGQYLTVDPFDGIAEADLDPSDFPAMLDPSALPLQLPASYVAAVRKSSPVAYWRFEEADGERFRDELSSEHPAIALDQARVEGGNGNHSIVFEGGDDSKRGLFVADGFPQFSSGEYSVELWMNAQSLQHSGLISLVETGAGTPDEAVRKPPAHRLMAIECTAAELNRWQRTPQGKISFSHRLRRAPDPGLGGAAGFNPPPRAERGADWHGHEKNHRGRADWHRGGAAPGTGPRFGDNWHFAGGSRDFESRVYSEARYTPGTWHHVVAVRENDRILLYLDGKLEAETSATADSDPLDLQVIIGRYSLASGWLGRPFHGRIDELAVYDRALSATEVRTHAAEAK